MINKLENDIENHQKDRDSVFYLDESFYNKLLIISNDKRKTNDSVGNKNEQVTIADRREDSDSEEEDDSSMANDSDNSSNSHQKFDSDEVENSDGSSNVCPGFNPLGTITKKVPK